MNILISNFNTMLNFYFLRGKVRNLEEYPFYTIPCQGQKPKAQFVLVQHCLSSSFETVLHFFFSFS